MTPTNSEKILKSDRVLLVEGADEVNLIGAMLHSWNIDHVQVIGVGGKDKINTNLEIVISDALAMGIELSAIGVLRDADDSPESALQSVTDALRNLSLPAPGSHGAFEQGTPSLGVFILPDGASTGAVEDLCWKAVEDTSAGECSTAYLECLEESGALASKNPAKTLVHAYLAAQEDPSSRVGEGALKGYWCFDHPAFNPLRDFVRRLAVI